MYKLSSKEIVKIVEETIKAKVKIDDNFIIAGPNSILDSVEIITIGMAVEQYIFEIIGLNINCYDMMIGVIDDKTIEKLILELNEVLDKL